MPTYGKRKWGWKTDEKKPKDDSQKLIDKLDRIFSKYIRLRDSDGNGYGKCITCGRFFYWKNATNGHFVLRDRMATRYHEKNNNLQCLHCNSFKSGRQFEHGQAIDRKYGKGTAEYLTTLGQARGAKIDVYWLELEIKKYKEKIKQLLTRKAF